MRELFYLLVQSILTFLMSNVIPLFSSYFYFLDDFEAGSSE